MMQEADTSEHGEKDGRRGEKNGIASGVRKNERSLGTSGQGQRVTVSQRLRNGRGDVDTDGSEQSLLKLAGSE